MLPRSNKDPLHGTNETPSERDARSREALCVALRRTAELSGGRAEDTDGVTLFESAVPAPGLWAGVIRRDQSVPPWMVLRLADAFFGAKPRTYTVMTTSSLDEDLESHLAAHGNRPAVDAPVPMPYRARRLKSARWGTPRVGQCSWRAYLAESVAHVIHVGTDPRRQGQGFGTRATAALTNEAFRRGADLVTLIATPPSELVWARDAAVLVAATSSGSKRVHRRPNRVTDAH
jgi:GNAT superfamily N-acetyltransferase